MYVSKVCICVCVRTCSRALGPGLFGLLSQRERAKERARADCRRAKERARAVFLFFFCFLAAVCRRATTHLSGFTSQNYFFERVIERVCDGGLPIME